MFNQCKEANKQEALTRVSFSLYAAQRDKVYLIKAGGEDEKRKVVDSAIVTNVQDSIIFQMPTDESTVYEIEVRETFMLFDFIPDAPYIRIKGDNILGKYTVAGSPGSTSLIQFNKWRKSRAFVVQRMNKEADSLSKRLPMQADIIKKLRKNINDSIGVLEKQFIAYADTVRNPAVFLAIYNNIDFGDDHEGLKKFVLRAVDRFPKYAPVQQVKSEALAMISIFEEEFNIGDSLPAIALPDLSGTTFSTASLKGKYYLIDFWSTWCGQCMAYNPYKQQLQTIFPADKLAIVSVALDDHKSNWYNLVTQNNYNWIQLIDEKMWRGTAANTLKFDSIPFNFLVSPQGRVVAKAIKPDSLIYLLREKIK